MNAVYSSEIIGGTRCPVGGSKLKPSGESAVITGDLRAYRVAILPQKVSDIADF